MTEQEFDAEVMTTLRRMDEAKRELARIRERLEDLDATLREHA